MKISRSEVHKFPVIYFFCGKKRVKSLAEFLFEESKWLFGHQNLASNLIEYENGDNLEKLLHSQDFKSLVGLIAMESKKKITLVKIDIINHLCSDFELAYFESSLSDAAVSSCKFSLKDRLALNVNVTRRDSKSSFDSLKQPGMFHFCEIQLDEAFIKNNHESLSDRFKDSFSSALYVDTQVPFVVLTPCFSGSADDCH